MGNDEDRAQEQGVPAAETQQVAERSLVTLLAGDLNTVGTTVVSAVAGAYAVKRVLGGKADQGGDGDSGAEG
jgi:hypothetical protein